jgi:hypothetical protein
MSFKDNLEKQMEQNKDYNENKGSDWYKFKEGDNTFRVLSEPVMLFEKFKIGICYTDCGYQGSPRLLSWVLDRNDNKIKLFKLPYTIGEQIISMETDPDYGFSGFPMPYDVTIKAVGAGTKEVKYSAPLPRPVKPIPDEIMTELATKKNCSDIIETMKKNQKDKHVADGTWQKEQDRKAALKEELKSLRTGEVTNKGYDYPTESINPDDIKFD